MPPWTDFEPTSKTGKIAAIYARVSRDDQVDGETRESIPLQIAQCQKYAKEHGWETKIFQDINMSGFSDTRPGLDEMLKEIRAGKIHTVIVQEPKRLGRDPIIMESITHGVLIRHGVQLVGVMQKIDIATDEGQFMLGLEALLSRKAIAESRRKSILAKRKKAMDGRLVSKIPYGYASLGRNKVTVHKEHAAIVRRVFNDLLEEKSLLQIARRLNNDNIPTATGHYWNPTRIRDMITQQAYIGQFEYEGMVVESKVYPAIIPAPVWERAQVILRGRLFVRPPIKQHLLTGIIKCGYCAERTGRVKKDFCISNIGRTHNRKTYYCCASRYHAWYQCENARLRETVLLECLDDIVRFMKEHYLALVHRTDHSAMIKTYHDSRDEIARLTAKREEREKDFAVGDLTKAEYKRIVGLIDVALEAARIKESRLGIAIEQTQGTAKPLIAKLRDWPTISIDEKRKILRSLIKIVVYRDRLEVIMANAKKKLIYSLSKVKTRTVIGFPGTLMKV